MKIIILICSDHLGSCDYRKLIILKYCRNRGISHEETRHFFTRHIQPVNESKIMFPMI